MRSAVISDNRDTTMRILPVRDGSLLVELADLTEALALFDALESDPVDGIREIIPAARTLLISFDPSILSADALTDALAARVGLESRPSAGELIEIPVRYDGEDL